jgi:hypothetical protein
MVSDIIYLAPQKRWAKVRQIARPEVGGYPKFVSQELNENYLPVWLQEAGYRNLYTGRLFNAYLIENYNSHFPAGWATTDFLLDP